MKSKITEERWDLKEAKRTRWIYFDKMHQKNVQEYTRLLLEHKALKQSFNEDEIFDLNQIKNMDAKLDDQLKELKIAKEVLKLSQLRADKAKLAYQEL